jgi:hypothetical protein
MADEKDVMNTQIIYAQYESGQAEALEDLTDVEATAFEIRQLEKSIDFYKEYKKKRMDAINAEIEKCNAKIEFFKQIILETLQSRGEKSVKFPGSVMATARKVAANWKINDEEEFIRLVRDAEAEGENVEGVLEVVTQTNIVKREANKLLKVWESNGKLEEVTARGPAGLTNVVERVPEKVSVTLKFEEEEKAEEIPDTPIPRKVGSVQYDKV